MNNPNVKKLFDFSTRRAQIIKEKSFERRFIV